MRIAVISDIHANLHALEAALAVIDAEGVDAVWCLGDTVGYGPRPSECCDLVAERVELCLAGNHDLVVLGSLDISDFSGEAAAAAKWTRTVLTEQARAFLARLEPRGARDGVELFHASARDPVWEYVLSEEVAWSTLRATSARLVLVGHSHVALDVCDREDAGVAGGLAPAGTEVELAGKRWLLNPGSVGQPRDGDPRAAWLLLDFEAGIASFRRVDYAIPTTQKEIRDAGLPGSLASRLSRGE
ncbi:MAG: metallophosphoesterase [Gaiellaceae bacterium]